MFFFFQAEDGIRDYKVTGVQTCALPISSVLGTAAGRPQGGPIPPEGEQRKAITVEMVADHESCRELAALEDAGASLLARPVTWEPAASKGLLFPVAIGKLALEQPAHAAVHTLGVGASGRDQAEQGPGRLRSRAVAAAPGLAVHVRGAGLPPAAVLVLAIGQPAHGAADGEAVHVLAHR